MIEEIIDFQEEKLWKSKNKRSEHKVCLVGKYISDRTDKFFGHLSDINMITVTLIKNNNEDIRLSLIHI